jgi:uncharacterized membrane protein YidH (DUF202 family)
MSCWNSLRLPHAKAGDQSRPLLLARFRPSYLFLYRKFNRSKSTTTTSIRQTSLPSQIMSSQPLLQAPPGKRIALPTRVEPKVYFANERTFMSWLNSAIYICTLGIGLLNFGGDKSRILAIMFTAVGIGAMMYALYTFYWRGIQIRKRGQAGKLEANNTFIALC